jgi:all-trans-8'-apo-beta-carotenal 15,15'-oxygenase
MNDFAPNIERAFCLDLHEESYTLEQIEGNVPDFLRGTYYLNGPARFSRQDLSYRHWLDGDGMVCALRFDDDVHFTNRYVRSDKFLAEQEAEAPLFRAFGTSFEGDQLVRGIALATPANVSVHPWDGRLLAFGEQGLPWELDAATLATLGPYTFHGQLNAISPFSAHPRIDSHTGEMFNFGVSFSARKPQVNLYRMDARGDIVYRRRFDLDGPCSMHDFAISRQHAVFYASPYFLDMQALIQGGTIMESLSWEPQRGSRLLVAGRETGDLLATIPIGQNYCLHLINAFESDGRLVVDVLELDQPVYDQYQVIPDLFTNVGRGQPVRYIVDVTRGEVVERQCIDYTSAPDFAAVDSSKAMEACDDFWMLGISAAGQPGRKFFDQLVRADWGAPKHLDIYTAPEHHYLGGEPVFVGDPNNDRAGVVICQLFDAEAVHSAFAIFDAIDVSRGPQALLHLKNPVHLGFHAVFSAAS